MKIKIEFLKPLIDFSEPKEEYTDLTLIKVDDYEVRNGCLHVDGKKLNVYYPLSNIRQIEIEK